MNKITLSYVITTRNKLPYLKEVMKRLLANMQADEEIVVADGASTDGTVEYLTDLYEQGKIHQFVSEPDKGEAHGYNKCLLMARGELIKLITDDDAFYYPAIHECKKFMLEHEEIDVMSGNTAGIYLEDLSKAVILTECERNYKDWLQNKSAVWFIGLPLMIRRKSLARTGLFYTGVVQVDTEYSLRITGLNINIAWNTALIVTRIDNPQSNFRSFSLDNRAEEERQRMWFFHNHVYRENLVKLAQKKIDSIEIIKIFLRPIKYFLKNKFFKNIKTFDNEMSKTEEILEVKAEETLKSTVENVFLICDELMKEYNYKNNTSIIATIK